MGSLFNHAVLQQQTIREPVSFSGVGLHSGNRVNMTFLPAPPNSGIRFRRVDLDGKPEIDALVENVVDTERSTTLGRGNVKVHTVEHVLATFAGFGIDNAVIELDSNEPPIGDGSARPYCGMIETAGVMMQGEKRDAFRVSEPAEVNRNQSSICVFPFDGLKISCTSSDEKGRFTQFFSLEIVGDAFRKQLASARTFCFFEEIEYLIRNGLIKGGSLENAVVIREDAVLTNEPLRYPEEFVRHKILDILGDLALLGKPVLGHIVAICPSHTLNCEFTRLLNTAMRKPLVAAQAFAPPPPAPAKQADPDADEPVEAPDPSEIDIVELMKILPHRYPFLMVDRVKKIDGNRIVAIKNVSVNESYFQGHFPGHPIMPGVLQLEAMAQVAGVLMLKQAENSGKIAYFMSAERVKWRRPVRPGDQLVIEVELTKTRGKIGKAKGSCSVDGEVVSEAEVAFMLINE
ncbi:MAG: bifunctional UDP-3-O-[3-hydroxymyristoyl] N-acetylglucosamine deacetylase/3-hydroxyacyl-ACP dehydratase [Verrucomicrobia bacterium]|jgi:UDP-3-O-[3-hydroxymyristoyl] N-acetylglucosamine deacetylase / 3-hydroxyacyl-[acyl-carrier-protein] dehydratase|nr:bifunctional UDP-3-O-[3-hydroxymyristoyl] N-acetylglucosamine deacetylase/3-hydroxyacyl-ACP dehydratase [Verrucomicrobiota bacterium]